MNCNKAGTATAEKAASSNASDLVTRKIKPVDSKFNGAQVLMTSTGQQLIG